MKNKHLTRGAVAVSKTTFPETLKGLVHKGGLRAQVKTEGCIRVGDEVVVL